MAHFAKVSDENIVVEVIKIPDAHEHRGQEFITNDLMKAGNWIQTSYTSRAGKRINPDTQEVVSQQHFRYNFAGVGYEWNPGLGADGAFIPPKPEGLSSWVIDPNTANWIPPIPMPEEGDWEWDENTISWIPFSEND